MAKPERAAAARSLRARLLLALLAPLTLLFILGGLVSYALGQYFADTVYDGWLFDSASSLALEVERRPDGVFVDIPPQTQRLFEWDSTDRTYFRIRGEHSGLVAGRADMPVLGGDIDEYEGTTFYDLLEQLVDDLIDFDLDDDEVGRFYDGRMDGEDVRIAEIQLPAAQYGEVVTIEVAETTGKRQGLAQAILAATLVPQILLIVVAAAAVRRAVRRSLAPLDTIAARLEASRPEHLAPIPDDDVPPEVLPLTRALRNLLMRLNDALHAQRRFISEAAHQLRTPLTGIKLQAEAILRENTSAEARPLIEALRQSTDRAARLSNQLLSLARAEPDGRGGRPMRRFDLHALAQETGAEWAPRALARGQDMHFTSTPDDEPVWITGDEDLLREAIGNLLDNAIKYGREGGTVQLRLHSQPRMAIEVEDDGPGIAEDQRPQMLQRFVRGKRGDGSGLGLPIAQNIARMHGGDLFLLPGPDAVGLLVRMELDASAGATPSAS
jgi:two-component system sensor histidine kinase TctE